MQKEQMVEIINGYVKAYNEMDVPAMLSFLHTEFVFHNVTDGRYSLSVNGRQEFETLATQALPIFTSRQQTINEIVYEGTTAKAKMDYEGTLAMDMDGYGGAGEVINFSGQSEFVFKDGLIQVLVDIT